MKLSPYVRLEDHDIMIKGDEIRFSTPMSHLSQYVDVENDERRRQWKEVTECWIGKSFGEFRKGLSKFGKIDCRRRIAEVQE